MQLPEGRTARTFWYNKRTAEVQRAEPKEEAVPPDPNRQEVKAIRAADIEAKEMQQQGKYLEALECMEKSLLLRERFCGPESEELWDGCRVTGELCNVLARSYMEQGENVRVFELLRKAEALTKRDDRGRVTTYNNLGCFYRREGKLHAALEYLNKAAALDESLGAKQKHPADTYLNLSAVYSELGRHGEALHKARIAVEMLNEELFSLRSTAGELKDKTARIAIYAVAWYNIGAEQEFLQKHVLSVESYRKGLQVAKRYLGIKHPLAVRLRNAVVSAQRNVRIANRKKQDKTWQPLQLPDLGVVSKDSDPPHLREYLTTHLRRYDAEETGRLSRAVFLDAMGKSLLKLTACQLRRIERAVYF